MGGGMADGAEGGQSGAGWLDEPEPITMVTRFG